MKKSLNMLFLKQRLYLLNIVLFMSTMVCATETAYVKILLHGATNPTRSTSFLTLLEDDEYTSAYEDGFDATTIMMQANNLSTLIFAISNGNYLSAVATNDLSALQIGFVSNNVDDTYTLTFENFNGRELLLVDKVRDSIITINASTPPYEFTIPAAQVGQVSVLDRFVIDFTPTVYQLCYMDGKFLVDNPNEAGTLYILDSIGNPLSNYAVGASTQTKITPSALDANRLYQVVGLQNDTLFFRAQ